MSIETPKGQQQPQVTNTTQVVSDRPLTHQAKLEKIESGYTSSPWWYDVRGFFILKLAYRSSLISQIRFFAANMGTRHLEVAIGTGTLFNMILKWRSLTKAPVGTTTAFDYTPKMLEGAISKFKNTKKMSLEQADVTALRYEENTFDTVNAANCLHCFPEISLALSELHRVLKNGGTMAGNIIIYPRGNSILDGIAHRINAWAVEKGILYSPYHVDEVQTLLKTAGFEVQSESLSGNCYSFVVKKEELESQA
jgi:ubiquinone/menaquinone biosynthesis C-methylase UbiE